MDEKEQYMMTGFQAVFDQLIADRPCGECLDCPVIDSFASIIENMRDSTSERITNDLGMKPVNWSKCHKVNKSKKANKN